MVVIGGEEETRAGWSHSLSKSQVVVNVDYFPGLAQQMQKYSGGVEVVWRVSILICTLEVKFQQNYVNM